MIGLVEATATPRDLVYEAWMQKDHMLELKPNDATLKRAPTGAKGGNVSFEGRDLAKQGFAGIAHRGIDIERIYPNADSATVRRNLFGEADVKDKSAATLDKLVTRFARRAFRRPVTDEQTAPYREIGRKSLAEGDSLPGGPSRRLPRHPVLTALSDLDRGSGSARRPRHRLAAQLRALGVHARRHARSNSPTKTSSSQPRRPRRSRWIAFSPIRRRSASSPASPTNGSS